MKSIKSCCLLKVFPHFDVKWQLVVKHLFVLFLLIPLSLSADPNTKRRIVNLNLKNVSIKQFFDEIQKQTDMEFIFNESDLKSLGKISCQETEKTLNEVLDKVLNNKCFKYEFNNNLIIVKKIEDSAQEENEYTTLTGLVSDEKGNPIPGVTVILKGTPIGTSTNGNGEYKLDVPKIAKKILVFSFIGMKSKEVKVVDSNPLKVIMKMNIEEMNEVVVTGYQIIDRKKVTSAVSTIKSKDLLVNGISSIDKMLEGKVTDMMYLNNSGEIGVTPRLRIRGTSTLIGNREPLWVLDGIVINDPVQITPEELSDPDFVNRVGNAVSGLNPQDIERIDVLKDASATALYGVKAANGVIVITTKKGSIGKTRIGYNMNVTTRQRPRYTDRAINLMNSKERVDFSKDLVAQHHLFSDNVSQVGYEWLLKQHYQHQINQDVFNQKVAELERNNTDWFSYLCKDAISSQHTVSVSGGNSNIRFYSSIGIVDENDVIRWNHNNRYTASTNLDISLSYNLQVSLNINANVSNRRYYQSDIAPIDYAYNTSRTIPIYINDHEYYFYKKKDNLNYYNYNILNELKNSTSKQKSTGVNLTANMSYTPWDWLSIRGVFSYSNSNTNMDNYWGEKTFHITKIRKYEYNENPTSELNEITECPFGGELDMSRNSSRSYTCRIQFDLDKSFGNDNQHNIVLNLGGEASSSNYEAYNSLQRGYFPDRGKAFIRGIDLNKYPKYKDWLPYNVPTITDNLSNLLSAYASLSYSYMDYVTLNVNTRIDGSNKFGSRSNEKLFPIWSASANYNLLEHLNVTSKIVDYISIKASYGFQGNMLDGQSPEMIIKKEPFNVNFNEPAAKVYIYPNPNLKWEKTSSMNFGLEFSLFDNAIQIGSSYYYKHTQNAFMPKTISTVNGIKQYTINSGTITNQGYNIDLTLEPIHTEAFRWTLSTSISKVINKLESNPAAQTYELDDFLDGKALVKGHAIETFWSYKYIGLNPIDGGPLFDDMYDRAEQLLNKSKCEVYSTVLKASGNREPNLQGSINSSVRYKHFRLGINLAYSLGSKVRLFKIYNDGVNFDPELNINRDLVKRWQKPGDEYLTNIPNIVNTNSSNNSHYMTHWSYWSDLIPLIAKNAWDMYNACDSRVASGNYLKCTNLNLNYIFPNRLLQYTHLSDLVLSISACNIFTIASSRLKGQTPQQSGFMEVQLSDRPMYSFGLNVSF